LEEKYNQVQEILKQYNQEHLLNSYESLNENEKKELLKEILDIDFKQLENLYQGIHSISNNENQKIEPIEYVDEAKLTDNQKDIYRRKGIEILKSGKYAVITMAGGQGTRLGHNGPKGTFKLGIKPDKSLFEILCEKLKKIEEEYQVVTPWYIMTSKENNDDTVKFFKENNYFNYPEEAIKFFKQGEIPMIDKNGKILLTEKGRIKAAADGHGGIFEAMFKNNVVEDLKQKNIEWIFIGPIDNPLVQMTDELMLGFSSQEGVLATGKSIVKANPQEKVGVFCKRDGRPSVVEYTEITEEMAEETDLNGELKFGESHINCNLFHIKAIEKIGNDKLPYHTAFKKATYMDTNGHIIKSTEPNCYKFESFIFDAFGKIDKMGILRGTREREFAPVKNAEGVDSPETARELYKQYYGI